MAFAAEGNLKSDDLVGMTFWLISIGMVAATVFFLPWKLREFLESEEDIINGYRSRHVSGCCTLLLHARCMGIVTGETPIVYRYIDWLITVPLQMVEFYLDPCGCWRSFGWNILAPLIGTVVMLLGGYCGEVGYLNAWVGFIIGMAGWLYILYEIFAGEAGKASADKAPESVKSAFSAMRLIVTVGWAIYPIGYFYGYLAGVDAAGAADALNIIYNIADVLNKIAFGVIIWAVAVRESESSS